MSKRKILFIDRDGTIIVEPPDYQIDSYEKLSLLPAVIPSLLQLKDEGYEFVMVTNQDGLGTDSFPHDNFTGPHNLLMNILASQGIHFESIKICPHKSTDNCDCRKPKLGLVMDYIRAGDLDFERSYVIGDRLTDVELAKNMGVKYIHITDPSAWPSIVDQIKGLTRCAEVTRNTKETAITAKVNLDQTNPVNISTGLGFFDHMLEQLAKHGGFSLQLTVKGDLHIDEHHTIEDAAITIGQALRQALGNKYGVARYGFLLPMDEALAQVALDLSGRAYFTFNGQFNREKVGELPTELVSHFFRSLADSLQATLNINVQGENAHHMIESIFKGVGRALKQAMIKNSNELPSTKGLL